MNDTVKETAGAARWNIELYRHILAPVIACAAAGRV